MISHNILQLPEFKEEMDMFGLTNGTAFCTSITAVAGMKEESYSTTKAIAYHSQSIINRLYSSYAKDVYQGEVSITVANSECYSGVDPKTVEHSDCILWVKQMPMFFKFPMTV